MRWGKYRYVSFEAQLAKVEIDKDYRDNDKDDESDDKGNGDDDKTNDVDDEDNDYEDGDNRDNEETNDAEKTSDYSLHSNSEILCGRQEKEHVYKQSNATSCT